MKTKLLFFAILLAIVSCKKDSNSTPSTAADVCATCKESISGYKPADFCGPVATVDKYISDLKTQGAQVGQSWTCTKH